MKRLAACIHVFYPELLPEIARCINSFDNLKKDIFVTTPLLDEKIHQDILRTFPACHLQAVENRGYDVGPFFEILNNLNLDNYDYVVKLHTKRTHSGIVNYLPLFGGQWRRKLLSFCKNRKYAEKAIALMDSDPSIGMIGNEELIMRPCDELVHSPVPDRSRCFIAGTMFLARASALKTIQSSASLSDFELFATRSITTLAHDYERKFGYALCDAGWKVVGFPQKTWFYRLFRPLGKIVYKAFLQP